jgi:predicted transcriptional regulator
MVELLSDEHTREVLEALNETQQTASTLRENINASKPTVYRRLNALEEAGIVEVSHKLCTDGHHAKTYSLVPCSVNIDIDGSGFNGNVNADTPMQVAD